VPEGVVVDVVDAEDDVVVVVDPDVGHEKLESPQFANDGLP